MRKIAITLLTVSTLFAAPETTTDTTFGERTYTGESDPYGNQRYTQEVTISTENFAVDTFWSRFRDASERQKRFTQVTTSATADIIVEATSACTLDNTLPWEGCSGQKPFLVNNEAVDALRDGDRVRLIFQVARDDNSLEQRFDNADPYRFYPLDVQRDETYYRDSAPEESSDSSARGGFFGYITSLFDDLFNHTLGFGRDFFGNGDIADVRYTPRSDAARERRQRYISNIIAGIDREHRMTMPLDGHEATRLDAAERLNDPASLLHYAESLKTTQDEQCRFLFLDLSPEGAMCRVMSGFGMDAWMPFFSHTHATRIDVNTITADTENALLAMAGRVAGASYFERDPGAAETEQLTLLQEVLKPVHALNDLLKDLLFGSEKASITADPVESIYRFDEDEAISMTLAVTEDGSRVDRFENFDLMALHATYGDQIYACRVKKKPGLLGPSSWEETFYEDVDASRLGPRGIMDNEAWVEWCQEQTKKMGLFDYLFEWEHGEEFDATQWLLGLINSLLTVVFGGYEVTDIENVLKRELVVELKKSRLDPVSPLTSKHVKIIQVKH